MHKASPVSSAKTPAKRSFSPSDLGYDAEFSAEVTPTYRGSGSGVAPQRPTSGSPRQNLSVYPGE